jgi:hypothetical protein
MEGLPQMALTPDEQAAVARWLAAGNQPKKVSRASREPTDYPPRRIVRDNEVDDGRWMGVVLLPPHPKGRG